MMVAGYTEGVKPAFILPILPLLLLVHAGCQRADINNPDAVREGVVAHIESRGDLSLSDLDIVVRNTSFQGDECQAEVLFVPEGQPADSGMTMKYTLDRVGDSWKVRPQSPSMPMAPMGQPGMHEPMGATPSSPSLPQGHPPVPPAGQAERQ